MNKKLLMAIFSWVAHILLVVYNAYLLFGNGQRDRRIGIFLLIINIISIGHHFINLAYGNDNSNKYSKNVC